MKNYLVKALRKFLLARGYSISKCPTIPFEQLSVFDLATTLLMKARNNELRFVQVGANDGVYGDSISRYALRYPWKGILIEPQPEVFEKLRKNYRDAASRMIFENVAIGKSGRANLVLFRPKGSPQDNSYPSSVVSFKKSAVANQLGLREDQLESVEVPCMTLDAILKRNAWQDFDLLLVDTEGLDYEVLQSISLSLHKPMIIQFEHGHLSPADISGAMQYLSTHDYQILYGGYYLDTIAVHKSFWMTVQ